LLSTLPNADREKQREKELHKERKLEERLRQKIEQEVEARLRREIQQERVSSEKDNMIKVTQEEIQQFREQLRDDPDAIVALDEIEVCEGDLEAAAYVLAINAGEEVVRSDPKWLDRFAQKCRRVICQEEFKDELLPDLSRELVAALIGYLVATGAFPVALATPVAIYVIKIGVKNFCKSSNS
jgi:hypothetical protein